MPDDPTTTATTLAAHHVILEGARVCADAVAADPRDAFDQPSQAMRLLTVLWEQPRGSWARINATMRRGLRLAIEAKLTFRLDDFDMIYHRFRAGWWIGASGLEPFYADACTTPNSSAWKAIEHSLNRTPLLYRGKRLYVGASLAWEEQRVTVTSIDPDGSRFVACAYDNARERQRAAPSGVFKIEAAELAVIEKARRAAAKAAKAAPDA
jgi:hypothetical protein